MFNKILIANRGEIACRVAATCKRLGVVATTTTNFLWNYDSVYLRCFGEAMSANAIPLRWPCGFETS